MFGAAYAALYDAIYRNRPVDEECDFVVATARNLGCPAHTLLDLGCGTGAHLAEFTRRGLSAWGVDPSRPMLDRARASGATLVLGDARDVRLERRFDVVVALFHVLSYMRTDDDLLAFFRTAEAHLATGGVVIADFWYAPAVQAQGAVCRETRFDWSGRRVTRAARPQTREDGGIDVHYTVVMTDAEDRTERFEELHPMRPLSISAIEAATAGAGLELRHVGAWLEERAPDEQDWSAYLVARSRS